MKETIEELLNLIDDGDNQDIFDEIRSRIAELQCCGNCANLVVFKRWKILCGISKEEKEVRPDHYCVQWQFDGLTRKEREA